MSEKKVQMYVEDNFHTNPIAVFLERHYGNKVQCHTNFPNGVKIDVFFLSGQHILKQKVSPGSLKERFGSSNAKVVAIAAVDLYLKLTLQEPTFKVDFGINKNTLLCPTSSENKTIELNRVLAQILESVTGQ